METTLTHEQRYALKKALDFDITRYLKVNSINSINGSERSDRHVNISKTICCFIFNVKLNDKYNHMVTGSWLAVHDHLANILTDRMDEVIGFPVFEPLYDVDTYKERFFDVIINNMSEIKEVAIKSVDYGSN
jgi:hypothetical protein